MTIELFKVFKMVWVTFEVYDRYIVPVKPVTFPYWVHESVLVNGYAQHTLLAEVHRIGKHSSSVAEAARGALLTLTSARAAGVDEYDVQELKKAGVP